MSILSIGGKVEIFDGHALAVGGASAVVGSDVPSDQIYQTSAIGGPTAAIPVSVSYSGTPGTIQASVVNYGTTTLATGATWQSLTASGGTATGTILVPRGGGYSLTFRDAANGVSWTSALRFFVGDNGVFYGQSNMAYWLEDATTYVHSNPTGRRQEGAGWNVISNALGETFPTTPATIFGGVTNPGLTQPGEIANTTGDSMANFCLQLQASTASPYGVFAYAVPGTAASYWAPGSGAGWLAMFGTAGSPGAFNKAPYTFDASFSVRWQGEDNASASGASVFLAALAAEAEAFWSNTGRNASSFKFGICTLGPTGGGSNSPYGTPGYFGLLRGYGLSFVANPANGAYLALNPCDLSLVDSVHLNSASHQHVTYRLALTTAIALGHTVTGSTGTFTTGAGPKITNISRSGNVLALTVGDMDGSTALLTGDGGTSGSTIGGFRVWSGAASGVALSGAETGNITPVSTAIAGKTIQITLPAGTTYPVSIDHQMADAPYNMPPVVAQIVYGNNIVPGDTLALPLQPMVTTTVS